MVHIFHFLQTGMVFENVNPFSWIFNAISSGKSCLFSEPFLTCLLDVRTLDFFPPAESWLVNSNFPRASRMQGGGLVRVALFWKSHCATCSSACVILYHVTGSFKGPIYFYPCILTFCNLLAVSKNIDRTNELFRAWRPGVRAFSPRLLLRRWTFAEPAWPTQTCNKNKGSLHVTSLTIV